MDIHGAPFFSITGLLTGFAVSTAIIAVGFALERRDAPLSRRMGSAFFNIAYSIPASLLERFTAPLAAIAAVTIGGAAGGLIPLPATGWGLFPAIAVYLLAMDFGEYLFHRAQHRIPFLWAMHALHHSDPDLNISSTVRHYWVEHLIKGVTVYLAVGLIFKTNAFVASSYILVSFYNYFAHMNVRVGFGRYSWLLNSPQFHRLHHSRLPRHHDRNFAGLFPFFDCLFGTYLKPQPGEFPPTGLDTGECPAHVAEALVWPLRRLPLFRISRSSSSVS